VVRPKVKAEPLTRKSEGLFVVICDFGIPGGIPGTPYIIQLGFLQAPSESLIQER